MLVVPRDLHFNTKLSKWGRELSIEEISEMGETLMMSELEGIRREAGHADCPSPQVNCQSISKSASAKEAEMRFSARYSLRNRLSSGKAKVDDLLKHPEEKRQLIPFPEPFSG